LVDHRHPENMKIVLWGTYDTGKPRIRILRDGLRAAGVEVAEIHTDIWDDVGDKSDLRGARNWFHRGLRLLLAYPRLVWRYLRAPAHDLILVSYPGQLDVLVLWLFARMRRKHIAFDWFISAFDTVVADRRLLGRKNLLARILWAGEWLSCRAADLVFMDTATHARRMEALFGLASNTLGYVWVGAERSFFESATRQRKKEFLQVLFYGQFIPLHGIDTIIEAARILQDPQIRWTLIGRGQEASRIRALIAQTPLPTLHWVDWIAYDKLHEWIASADICLGIFGTSEKAASVIPNKVFQIIASGCPLITRDSSAIRELLGGASPGIRLIPAGDARALAEAIRDCTDQINDLPRPCHEALREHIRSNAIATQFLTMVENFFPKTSVSK
jgi:glycosyltransferase involved in cell wall biosynthesis